MRRSEWLWIPSALLPFAGCAGKESCNLRAGGFRSVIELSKYVFETLRKDRDFNLYRGTMRDDTSWTLVLSPVAEYPTPENLKRLEYEYSLRDGNRASGVIARTRALFKKAPVAKEPFDINEIIQEVLAITQAELQRNRVSLRTEFAKDLPLVTGDKIQLLEGNTLTEGKSASVLFAVRDSGPGLDSVQLQRVSESYYTTKSQGMGLGLVISRSIIEAHLGHLWATGSIGF